MATCPAGHATGDMEFCDVCGSPMTGAQRSVTVSLGGNTAAPPPCPECGESLAGRFCEGCGFDTMNPYNPRTTALPDHGLQASPAWIAAVRVDRGYYERLMAQGGLDPSALPFPTGHPERQYPLSGQYVRIGRRSVGRGVHPEIDLSLPPEDPAVSHEHAVLLAKPDGTWTLVDLGATNGTAVNDDSQPITAHVELPLTDGDRIYLGAWTVITVRKG